ncbi:MAG: hypothetical protein ABW019_08490 [Chitinophagaceae bacterium]
MKYHNNHVYFTLSKGYSLVSGSYTVNSFFITEGQDPKENIEQGYTTSCNSKGELTFVVGCSSSTEVGDWFNLIIPRSQNTFNDTAGKLNFSFLGTLRLTITGGLLGSRGDTFTFRNIILAQKGGWWFGGQDCFHIEYNQVMGRGTNSVNNDVFFLFRRGGHGNSDNEVLVTPNTL